MRIKSLIGIGVSGIGLCLVLGCEGDHGARLIPGSVPPVNRVDGNNSFASYYSLKQNFGKAWETDRVVDRDCLESKLGVAKAKTGTSTGITDQISGENFSSSQLGKQMQALGGGLLSGYFDKADDWGAEEFLKNEFKTFQEQFLKLGLWENGDVPTSIFRDRTETSPVLSWLRRASVSESENKHVTNFVWMQAQRLPAFRYLDYTPRPGFSGTCVTGHIPGAFLLLSLRVEFVEEGEVNARDEFHRFPVVRRTRETQEGGFGPRAPLFVEGSRFRERAMEAYLKKKTKKVSLHVVQMGGNSEASGQIVKNSTCQKNHAKSCVADWNGLIANFQKHTSVQPNYYRDIRPLKWAVVQYELSKF